jgi:eukaryotic-like serine/threonine-protein kinase
VWLADHLQLDTRVVVKVMAHGLEHRADILARFAREAMICAQVKSPHVVQVFDTGTTDDGHPYIVMEHLEGHDLGKHLQLHGPMMPTAFVPIVVQLAKALARAHRAGIVHRDLKPENVFLCENEASNEPFVKLLDFGTAKVELPSQKDMTSTDTGQVIGTPLYMSPEQILGEKEIDHRSDIWSLGVVVFEALTGKTPFEGATIAALALAIHDATPKLSDVVPEMPAALDAWFSRACTRDKSERFQSVREAADAFVVAATGAPLMEPIESMALRLPSTATVTATERPVSMSPLIDTLPKPGSEQRKVTVAATAVIATALGLSALMIARNHEAPKTQGIVQIAPASATAIAPPEATPPAPMPPPLAEAPMEPEPTAPAAEPAKPPKPNPPMLKGPKATWAPPAKAVRPVAAKSAEKAGEKAGEKAPANPDEDLERLSNIPQPSEKLPPPAIPAE